VSFHTEKRNMERYKMLYEACLMVAQEASNPMTATYIAEDCKRDLVLLRYELDKMIKTCPDFGYAEKKWEQEIMMRMLKD
jgi:hypothetical protein